MNHAQRHVRRVVLAQADAIQTTAKVLGFGRGTGDRGHHNYENLACESGLESWEEHEGNHGRMHSSLEPTDLGKELESIRDQLRATVDRLEQLADRLTERAAVETVTRGLNLPDAT